MPASYISCTKWPARQQRQRAEDDDPPFPLEPRNAQQVKARRRCDVERRTEGRTFWGEQRAPGATPARAMTRVDFPAPHLSSEERRASEQQRRERATAMRTESIRHGDAPLQRQTEASANMRRFERALYVGRVIYPPGGPHKKTKSELFVSRDEVAAWQRGLTTMSRRQFRAPYRRKQQQPKQFAGHAADKPPGMAEIQADMLSSHFQWGDGSGEEQWASHTNAVYSPRRGLHEKPARATGNKESSVPLRDPNRPQGSSQMMTTTAASFPAKIHRIVDEQRRASAAAARPAATPGGADTARGPAASDEWKLGPGVSPDGLPLPVRRQARPQSAAPASNPLASERRARQKQHQLSHWQLGYTGTDPVRYVSQNKQAFRALHYVCPTEEAGSTRVRREEEASARRDSRSQQFHSSAVPL